MRRAVLRSVRFGNVEGGIFALKNQYLSQVWVQNATIGRRDCRIVLNHWPAYSSVTERDWTFCASSRNCRRNILPTLFCGSSALNSTDFGTL